MNLQKKIDISPQLCFAESLVTLFGKATSMSDLNVYQPDGFLYIVADSHLDESTAPTSEFIQMLQQLESPHTLVCLGDLFKIWLAPPKFWAPLHRDVMKAFRQLLDQGTQIVFVAGNREMLLPKKLNDAWKKQLPFSFLSHQDWYLNWGDKRFGFIHGDTINTLDLQYLRWKAISHSAPFELIFHMMPGPLARAISERIEARLAHTNKEYRVNFPEDEVQKFADQVLAGVDEFFVGHFHTDRMIHSNLHQGSMRMVPDWLSQRCMLKISPEGKTENIYFQR